MKKTIAISFVVLFILLMAGYVILTRQDSDETTTDENVLESNSSTNIQTTWFIPQPGITWQWQLSGTINTTHDVALYDIDLVNTPQSTIEQLHSNGSKVICYFSAGSWESFREDAADFPDEVIGKTLDGWADEKWLDISNYELFASTIRQRLDVAVQKECDGVEPDNIDGYQNNSGFDLTYEDQRNYNLWLSTEAHERNLSIALKNDLDQVDDLVDYFDFAINEQCFEYDECETLLPFIQNNKAVLGVEYNLNTDEFCETAASMNFSWLKMNLDLDGSRIACK